MIGLVKRIENDPASMKMISPHMKELKSLKMKPVPKYFSELFIDENLTGLRKSLSQRGQRS